MLYCHVYGILKSGDRIRVVCAGNGTRPAKALLSDGEAAAKAGKYVDAAAAFRKAIDADPDFVEAHQRLIEVTQRQEAPASRTRTGGDWIAHRAEDESNPQRV